MALFGSARDASLIRSLNRELINDFVDTEVALFKLSLEDSRANMYDESDNKIYFKPVRINCLIEKGEKSYVGDDAGYDSTREGFFNFLRDDLKDKNIIVEGGDIIEYDGEFYEIDSVHSSQYWTGRNPSRDLGFTQGDREEFGLSIAVRVTAHVTRRNRLNIQEVRSGVSKGSIIPRNL